MLSMIELICFGGGIASVGMPLFYAVATLDGLRHKTVYPIFRFVHTGRYQLRRHQERREWQLA